MRRLLPAILLVVGATLSAFAAGGCGKLKSVTAPFEPPNTTIFIDGPVDTNGVNHIVHLHWFGTDPHGYIAGFEVRLVDTLSAPADTTWKFTTRTDSVVTVYTPNGKTSAVFEARAINDHGVRDPDPARQRFYFRNVPPIVKLVGKPNAADRSDTTFASASVTWSVTDVDGDPTRVTCRLWMDGHADSPVIGSNGAFTVPSSQFRVNGVWASGRRTLYIQGIDDGGMAGPVDSVSWYVRAPVAQPDAQGYGRLLLVDDVPTTDASNVRNDTLYANAITASGIPSTTWTVLRLQSNQPFRSAADLEQTMKQFRTVVWYRGEQTAFSSVLANYGAGIGPYLESGGKLMIESLNLIQSWSSVGPFDVDFVDRYLNADGVFLRGMPPDSTASWGLNGSGVLPCPAVSDSLQNRRIIGGMRAFKARDWSQVVLYAPAHVLSEDNPADYALALAVPQANGGMFVASTYPMVSGTISTASFPQRSTVVLRKILALMGLPNP